MLRATATGTRSELRCTMARDAPGENNRDSRPGKDSGPSDARDEAGRPSAKPRAPYIIRRSITQRAGSKKLRSRADRLPNVRLSRGQVLGSLLLHLRDRRA
jgi:hypothetical protein